MIRHRSFSQVRQLRTCGWQYKLERLEGVASRPSVPAVAGVAIHSATELVDALLLKGRTDREGIADEAIGAAESAVLEAVVSEDAEGWPVESWRKFGRPSADKPNGEDLDWFRDVGIPNSIRAYLDWRLDDSHDLEIVAIPGFGPAVEVPFNYYIGDQLIHGYIDRVFTSRSSGGYFPLDIKSGQKPKTSEQLGLYAAALSKALGWSIPWGGYLFALKTGKARLTPPLNLSHWTDDKLAQIYLPATQLIDQKIFIPNPGESCRLCSVSDSCEYVAALA